MKPLKETSRVALIAHTPRHRGVETVGEGVCPPSEANIAAACHKTGAHLHSAGRPQGPAVSVGQAARKGRIRSPGEESMFGRQDGPLKVTLRALNKLTNAQFSRYSGRHAA